MDKKKLKKLQKDLAEYAKKYNNPPDESINELLKGIGAIKYDTGGKPKKWFECPNCKKVYELDEQ